MIELGGVLAATAALAAFTWRGWPTRGLVAALAALAAGWFVGPAAARWSAGEVQTWNVFHYTVGSRFFGELGYYDLYLGALAADAAGDDHFGYIDTVRDLHTYRKVDRDLALRHAPQLSPERTAELQRVIGALAPTLTERDWRDVFVDRGYNATPAYTAVAGPLAAGLPSERAATRWASTWLDPLALAVGLAALGAAFGAEAAAWVVLLAAVFPGTQDRWLGAFLAYDWLAACLVGLAATHRDRPGLAAAAFAWATASRLFPAALVASLLLPDLRTALRERRLPDFARVFVPTYAACLGAAGLLGCTTTRGPGAWAEFVPRFWFHSQQHAVGRQRIGLRHLLLGDTPDALREATAHAQAGLWFALVAVGLAVWLVAAARSSRVEAAVLGFVPVFLVAVSSRYYWAGFALAGAAPGRGRVLALGFLAASACGYGARAAGLDDVGRYVAIELALGSTLALGVALAATGDRR
ncbi:MAG: hypothetical protein ABMA64_35105 [Myxococcota bacterium]